MIIIAYTPNTWAKNEQLTHKQMILQQMLICNKLFSGYEASPTIIDPKIGTYDFTPQAHTGKSILLGVLTLEANARPILPEEYQTRTDPIKKKIMNPINCLYIDGRGNKATFYGLGIIAPDAAIQLQAILLVQEMYIELIAAIYAQSSFSDVINKNLLAPNENITEEEITAKESVEFANETLSEL